MSESPASFEGQPAEVVHLDRRTLLLRHKNGDASAFTELVQTFRAQVYSYIIRCGVRPPATDDLFQEIFLKVHRAAHTYQPERPLEPWLFTVVANTVRSHYRKHSKVKETELEESAVAQSTLSDGHDTAEAQETAAWLETELEKLPETQREVVLLCCYKNLSQIDVSKILGIPVNTVKTNLRRARQALAEALIRRNKLIQREVSA